ncbi:hypothetical protein, unlikely [Trypanosoma brucei gambiense DAL972]|uniref:T. brucei spp.-specific protein n=1 Tax=Trypanosoma brucei gambiense (strain MHOM/CI/86/DAL972) TaxID=679716 RepID=C9ZV44_TRYB9|nr:hypothetical protein, unlikely [Trypanosoma brucei gambiense DAL972]CBH13282.1 hypothetical protein, unlikely [Trypanosoma brucei gambiense DAL972]|eukprot:XP_011775559.1 hypothetical protein, unlikely [Trypanosoma brucei gambiense DAL972]
MISPKFFILPILFSLFCRGFTSFCCLTVRSKATKRVVKKNHAHDVFRSVVVIFFPDALRFSLFHPSHTSKSTPAITVSLTYIRTRVQPSIQVEEKEGAGSVQTPLK